MSNQIRFFIINKKPKYSLKKSPIPLQPGLKMSQFKFIGKDISTKLSQHGIETWKDLQNVIESPTKTPQHIKNLIQKVTLNHRSKKCLGMNSRSKNKKGIIKGNRYYVRTYNRNAYHMIRELIRRKYQKTSLRNKIPPKQLTARQRGKRRAYPKHCKPLRIIHRPRKKII